MHMVLPRRPMAPGLAKLSWPGAAGRLSPGPGKSRILLWQSQTRRFLCRACCRDYHRPASPGPTHSVSPRRSGLAYEAPLPAAPRVAFGMPHVHLGSPSPAGRPSARISLISHHLGHRHIAASSPPTASCRQLPASSQSGTMSSQPEHPTLLIPGPIEFDDAVLQSMSHFR